MKRVVFSFDDRSLESLSRMVEQGRVPPQGQMPQPYSGAYRELEVKNPETGETRVIVIPAECPDCDTSARCGRFECATCGREWS